MRKEEPVKRAEIKKMIEESPIHSDRVIFRKDGTVSFRFGFFYRFGKTAESYAEQIKKTFPHHVEIVDFQEVWQAWPRDSYWEVNCKF